MVQVLQFSSVTVARNTKKILSDISLEIHDDQRWVILGPNGAGKSTLLKIAAGTLYPTTGTATILGERLGRTNVAELKTRIGFVASSVSGWIPETETVRNAVLTAAFGVSGRWTEEYEQLDYDRADEMLAYWSLSHLADRKFGSLSDGEKKRTLLARAVLTDPELLLLDEPASSLDLGSREQFLRQLSAFSGDPTAPSIVMVTHHLEEIPVGFTHALLVKDGAVHASGVLEEVVTSENFSTLYDQDIKVVSEDGRFTARAASTATAE